MVFAGCSLEAARLQSQSEEDDGEKSEGVEIDFATGQFVLDIIPNANLDPSRVRFGREAVVVLAQISESGETETVQPED